ncbi:MAG TPA: glycosyltransferase family 2 protein [Polyangiaceae bacterium]|nr:glycosyltransferase family 2 protein [Polyangiaceae bacterium]
MPEVRLSAIVTCYKDAPAIPVMYRRLTDVLSSLVESYEIIFVNDASPDDADSVLAQLTARDEHVLAVEHSRNFGSQHAFLSGMQIAAGDAVILLDGDLQDPPELIATFYERWREGNDVVYGRRLAREGSVALALFAKLFYLVFRRMAYVPIPLDAGDFALMDRKVVNALLALPEADQFLRGLRAWVGFKQTGVDHVRPARAFGRSTHSFLKNVWWAKKAIFSFSFAPIELLGYVAAAMTAVSSCALVYQLIDVLRRPEVAHGVSLVIVLVMFFGSLQLLAIAMVGEYLIKIFEETKRRPRFIRKAVRYRDQHLTTPSEIDAFLRERTRGEPAARGGGDPT